MLLRFIFPPPPSILMTAMSVISFTSLANAGFSELRGKHMQYSKFWNFKSQKSPPPRPQSQPPPPPPEKQLSLSGRTGMLVAYTPAFVVSFTSSICSLMFLPQHNIRHLLLCSALTLHYFKRILEVVYVHNYSGGMSVDTAVPISLSYFLSTASMIYGQYLSQGVSEPPIDLKEPGILLFLVGISGNFYHHYLLSKMRSSKGDKEYKIPKGGLFGLVICPHYLFEILGFVGVSFISQTLYAFSFTMGTALYLTGRSFATRKWYRSKFTHFPPNVKALIPYVL